MPTEWPQEKYTSDNIVELSPGEMTTESVLIFRQILTTLDAVKEALEAGGYPVPD